MPDLQAAVRRVDVEVTRAADDLAGRFLADDERHRAQTLAHVERGGDVFRHFLRRCDRRVPQPPQLAVGRRTRSASLVLPSERLDAGVIAGQRYGLDEAHDYRPAARHESDPLEQMHVLLVLEQARRAAAE